MTEKYCIAKAPQKDLYLRKQSRNLMALLEVKSVSKLFNADGKQMEALHDINLDIGENEFVCFIGPSGCGKTTLLRVIAGLEEPSSGEIRLEGLR